VNLRQRLRAGEQLLCFSVNFPSPTVVEMGAIAGFDFYNIDAEHGPLNNGVIDEMVRAADAAGVPAIVRPPNGEPDTILRILDVGAAGVMVPQVSSPEIARAVVDAVKYPPLGKRGLGIVRANRWGDEPAAESTARANDETVIMALVEDIAAVEAIDAILEVEEIDVIWIGPADLSQSMGITGQYGHPDLQAATARAVGAARKAGRGAGVALGATSQIEGLRAVGYNCLAVQAKTLIINGGREFVKAFRNGD
jgi:2-keto-3-deoxy-L-rhamnonate aldolase RhmA